MVVVSEDFVVEFRVLVEEFVYWCVDVDIWVVVVIWLVWDGVYD